MAEQTEADDEAPREVRVHGVRVDSFPELAPEAAHGSVRPIAVIGDDVLHRPCREVTEFATAALGELVDDMFLTMYAADGVGLAANQVGVDLRLFVYDCADEDGVRHVGYLVNPVLERIGDIPVDDREGCLSVPGPHAELPRLDRVVTRGRDIEGRPLAIEGSGYFARCLQHETDHLDGRLYVDLLEPGERADVLAQMQQMRDEVEVRRAENAAALLDTRD